MTTTASVNFTMILYEMILYKINNYKNNSTPTPLLLLFLYNDNDCGTL